MHFFSYSLFAANPTGHKLQRYLGSKCYSQTYPPQTGWLCLQSALATHSRYTCFFCTDRQLPLPRGLWASPKTPPGAVTTLGSYSHTSSRLDTHSGFCYYCNHHTPSSQLHAIARVSAGLFIACVLCSDTLQRHIPPSLSADFVRKLGILKERN